MTHVDLLSDTTYRQQAIRQLHRFLSDAREFPVESSQIYGLRQIARQQPLEVSKFAEHQRERAEKLGKEDEVGFWDLVANLCKPSAPEWSIYKEGHAHLPEEIRDENIPKRQKGMKREEQRQRKALRRQQQEWFNQWANENIPAFFERFCTQCLYRKGMIEMSQSSRENDASSYQEQSKAGSSEAMQRAFTDAKMQ